MVSSGPNYAGAGANYAAGGTDWTNPGNAVGTPNGSPASIAIVQSITTDPLYVSQFGFAIDPTADASVLVEVYSKINNAGTGYGFYVNTGFNTPFSATITPDNGSYSWKSATLPGGPYTHTQINDTAFGVYLQAFGNAASPPTWDVDGVRLTVTYTPSGQPLVKRVAGVEFAQAGRSRGNPRRW